ncbi:hypothetical protein EMCG_07496 [[Emmonsia] crescens]|uniref:Uncharacterized protein n=1 Tax=[Emmonsia] crescens TaxID=73230 RepID=A0A0G2I851_9EURO|nr:hypothetical protein EMCG_07496 [Emmonsia crescens UAMH 3008]
MALGHLSTDLIVSIAEQLEFKKDVNALARTSRGLYAILNPYLYRNNTHEETCSTVWRAVKRSETGTIQRFKDAGVDLSKLKDPQNSTDNLIHALSRRCGYRLEGRVPDPVGVIRVLTDNGVDINAKNSYGSSALLIAAARGDTAILMPLIDCGADVHVLDPFQSTDATMLHVAAHGACPVSFIEYLVDTCGLDVHQRDTKGQNALHRAVRGDAYDVACFLITRGVDVNAQDELGFAPVHFLAHRYTHPMDLPMFKVLVENGADVNIRNNKGKTPFHLGTKLWRDVEFMELLLEKGADVKAVTPDKGFTAMHLAAKVGALDLLPLYVKYGGDINARDARGRTPLHLFVETDLMDDLEQLTDLGADLDAKDSDGQTFHDLCEQKADRVRRGVDSEGNPLVEESSEDDAHVLLHIGLLENLRAAFNP